MSKTRKILSVLLVMALALSMLAGCGSKPADTKPADAEKPADSAPATDGGEAAPAEPVESDRVLHIATSGDTGTLHPLSASGGFVSMQYNYYEPLWTFDGQGERVWKLATAYDQVGPTEFTLKLREGVTFSNGNPMTAEDVYFSAYMCKDDARFYLNVGYIDFDKTNIVDDYTIDVWYTSESYTQDNSFSQLMILDKESYDAEALSTRPIGTGPYVVTDYVVNSHVTVEARDDYWGGKPAIKTIEYKVINETAQMVNALEVGDVDICAVPVDEIEYVEGLGYNIAQHFGGYANTALYSFAGALSSKEARYAVSLATDRESISYLMYKGISSVPSYPTSEHCLDYEERFANMNVVYSEGYNPELAKEYAEKAGLVGKTLKIITNGTEAYNDAATIIQSNLEAIGVKAEIQSYDSATYFSVVMDESNFDIALFYLSSPSMLACDVMSAYLTFIPLGWHDEARDEYQAVTDKILTEMDDAKRADLTYECLEIFEDYCPWFALNESVTSTAVSKDVGGANYYLAGNLFPIDLYWVN